MAKREKLVFGDSGLSVEEHVATLRAFLEGELEPLLAKARSGRGRVYFVDAAHFVRGSYLCCVWCLVRLFIRSASGGERYNVLAAWNATAGARSRVSSDTMVELLDEIAGARDRGPPANGPTTLVLDNARYQHCAKVKAEAKRRRIRLLFLPAYSPNPIERLWKFAKKKALRGRHHEDFDAFIRAVDECLDGLETVHKEEIGILMTRNVQTFDETSFLAA